MNYDRVLNIIFRLIEDICLDLSGLNVLSECASGPYALTAVMIHKAGGQSFNVGKDSIYGSFKENHLTIQNILKLIDVDDAKFYKDEFPQEIWSNADIIPNLGFIRPINKMKIKLLKRTAVIPLMWETWEFRHTDIDLEECIKQEIPVIGTNESNKIDLFGYNGFFALKLLFKLGLEVYHNTILILGSGKTASSIVDLFDKLDLNYEWFSMNGGEEDIRSQKYENLKLIYKMESIDSILIAEHLHNIELIGNDVQINFIDLKREYPGVSVGHICGNIDLNNLKESGIPFFPKEIKPFGHMSYQAFELGPRAVLELNALGLKVGEIAVKQRLSGKSIEETIEAAINSGFGHDFEGGFLNYGK